MTRPAAPLDILRQSFVVIFALLAPVASNAPQLVGRGRTIAEQSAASDTLLVPPGIAFAIWGPIFLGLLGYAVIQGLPSNRARTVHRRTGWLMATSLALVCAWSIAASYAPVAASRWLTALIFVPAMVTATMATWRFAASRAALSLAERILAAGSVGLFAGWCSLAVFLNWAQLGVNGPLGFGMSETVVCVLALALGLAWIAYGLHNSRGALAYAFSPIWGLAFLSYGRLAGDERNAVIGGAALVGIVLIAGTTVAARRRS